MKWLLWSVALTFVQMLVAVSGTTLQVGLPRIVGNREGLPESAGWTGRAQRAHRNMLESLPLFIALILIAEIARRTNGMTLLGAQLFFWGRLAHGVIYVAGLPGLRTLAWTVSVVGLILIFLQLI